MHVRERVAAVLAIAALATAGCGGGEGAGPEAPDGPAVASQTVDVPVGRLPEGSTYDFGPTGGGPADVSGAFFIGHAGAPVTVAAFGDFECRFCARSEAATAAARRELLESGTVRILYLDFPLPVHARSRSAAEFARCTGRIGGARTFWRAYATLHRTQDLWSTSETVEAGLRAVAREVGTAWSDVRSCMESDSERSAVERHRRLAQRVGVRDTPTNFFNGIPRAGAITGSEFRRLVDAVRTGTRGR